MSVSGIFHSKSNIDTGPLEQDMWELSWITINAFCPTLKEDIAALTSGSKQTTLHSSLTEEPDKLQLKQS